MCFTEKQQKQISLEDLSCHYENFGSSGKFNSGIFVVGLLVRVKAYSVIKSFDKKSHWQRSIINGGFINWRRILIKPTCALYHNQRLIKRCRRPQTFCYELMIVMTVSPVKTELRLGVFYCNIQRTKRRTDIKILLRKN